MNTIYRLAMILLIIVGSSMATFAQKTYDVLFIQSYSRSNNWVGELNEGLKAGFDERDVKVNITTEFLDSRSWLGQAEMEVMRRICQRANKQNYDLIITSNDEALYDLLACGDSLPRKVPVMFFNVVYPNQEVLANYSNVYGLEAPKPFHRLLETIKEMFPSRKQMILVSDASYLGQKSLKEFDVQWNAFSQSNPDYKLSRFNINDDQTTNILYEIRISPKARQSILIMPYWGLFMSSIAKVSKAPCFTVSDESLLQGGLCALAPYPYEEARRAALMAVDVLQGKKPENKIVKNSKPNLIFDYKQLDFFKMNKDDVPRGSIIINEPLWKKYQPLFLLFYSALVVILVLAIVALYRANRREFKRRYYAQTRLLLQSKMVDQRNEFDNVFHSIHEGVIIYGADFKIHFVNKAAAGMVSLEFDRERNQYENLPAGSFLKIYHKGDEVLYKLLNEVKRTGASVSIPEGSFMLELKTNGYFSVWGEVIPLYSKSRLNGYVLSFRNIAADEVKKRFFNLAVEESSIYPWQFNVSDGVYTFPKGFIERMGLNSTSGRLSRSELRRKIHPADLPGIKIEFDALLAGDKNNSRIAFRLKNKKGQYEWWEYRMMVLNGLIPHSPSSILGVCQSIQRHKDVEAELIAARDKAMQSDRLKTAFLANMSHEIRTPLNSIVGFSGLLKEIHSFSEEEVAQFVDTINQNCELLLSLISDILDMSRIESGAMDFQIAECNLSLLVDEVYQSQRFNIPPAVSLLKNVPLHEEKQILADPVRLKQILNNLINNASKFTKEGSITVGYHLNEPGFVTFFVEDTGIGISEDDQKHIFERFFKVNSFAQGTGLGLSICHTIVERMHGTIQVTSQQGKGTCFTVRIPDTED